jgi:hypothetical protein
MSTATQEEHNSAPTRADGWVRLNHAINGLPLPQTLVDAITEGQWRNPGTDALRRVFREAPVDPTFYGFRRLERENARWRKEDDPAYFGRPDGKQPPGDIDPEQSLLIGDMGPDLPIALDFRASPDDPRVLYLHSGGDSWITIAASFEELLVKLGLAARRRKK